MKVTNSASYTRQENRIAEGLNARLFKSYGLRSGTLVSEKIGLKHSVTAYDLQLPAQPQVQERAWLFVWSGTESRPLFTVWNLCVWFSGSTYAETVCEVTPLNSIIMNFEKKLPSVRLLWSSHSIRPPCTVKCADNYRLYAQLNFRIHKYTRHKLKASPKVGVLSKQWVPREG